MGVDLKGKIVIVRYGDNFRGVKPFLASQYGAVGVIIYSDPWDDGYYKGDIYPKGPWRPATGVQRGSVQYLFRYPGDPDHAGHRLGHESAGEQTYSSRSSDRSDAHSGYAAVLCRRNADHAEPRRAGIAAKLAGRASLHLSRGPWTGEGTSDRQAGLSLHHHLGRDRHGQRIGSGRTTGWSAAIIAMPGCLAPSIPIAAPLRSSKPYTASANLAEDRMASRSARWYSPAGMRKKRG